MSTVIDTIERAQLRRVPTFQAGDRLRVHFQVIEGTRRRTQVFEGVAIKRQGTASRETFTVRKQSFGVGVERTFPLHSPKIEKIEVAARGDVRRAKLYYLRDRVGKAARVRERGYVGPEEIVRARPAQPPGRRGRAAGRGRGTSDAAERRPRSTVVEASEDAEASRGAQRRATTQRRSDAGGGEADVGDAAGGGAGRGRRTRASPPRATTSMRRGTSARLNPPADEPAPARPRQSGRRVRPDRRARARAGVRDPGLRRQAVPDSERVDGADAARSASACSSTGIGNDFFAPVGRRHRRLPPAGRAPRMQICGDSHDARRRGLPAADAAGGTSTNYIKRVVAGPAATRSRSATAT